MPAPWIPHMDKDDDTTNFGTVEDSNSEGR